MLAVHFVEHHLDVVPLADFVEAVTWVVVDSTGGSLVGDEGEHGAEDVLAGFGGYAVLSAGGCSGNVAGSTGRYANGFLDQTDARIRHDGDRSVAQHRPHGRSLHHDLGNTVKEDASMGAGQQKGVLEDDGVGRYGVGKTSLVLVGESPKHDEEQQPRNEEVVIVNRDEIVRCVVAAEQVHDVADEVVERDDDRQEGDEQKRHRHPLS